MAEEQRVPLSQERHRARFWRRFTSYEFARGWRQVPLVLAEVEAVAAAMPVVFARDAEGGPHGLEPVALLRLVPGGPSAFVSPAGLWLATYVPSRVRVHPFSAASAGDGRLMLMIDEASGLVTDRPDDEPFFAEDGGLAPATAELVDFFRQREASALRARQAAARLRELGLMVPFAPAVEAPAGAWDGLWRIDRDRYDALEDARWLELRRLGAVELAQAHFVSLAQVPWLARAEAVRDEEAAGLRRPAAAAGIGSALGAAGQPSPSERGVEDFLAALAASTAAEAPAPGRAGGDEGSEGRS